MIWAGNDHFQLPVNLGNRFRRITVNEGELNEVKLVMQPKGLDVLGDWEDLCGLVFG